MLYYFHGGAFFLTKLTSLPILQCSVLASHVQRPWATQKNRGAENEGIGWEEKRAGWETWDGSRCQEVWWRGGGGDSLGAALRIHVYISLTCFDFHRCCCSGVSHSVTSDMHIIQQENPFKSTKGRLFAGDDEDDGCITSRSVCNYMLYISVCLIPGRSWFSSWLKGQRCLEGLMDVQSIFWGVS